MNKRLKFNHLFFGGLLRSPCLLCLAANSSALGLCQPCLDDLPWLPDALCSQCALPCTGKVCGHCLSDPPYFDACYGVFSYQFPISALLLKNRVPLHAVDTVIAMPMHPQRLKESGFNQALEIARVLYAEQAHKLDFDSVQRQKNRPAQVSLSWQARLKNIKGAFKLQSASRITGQRIAILDDVMTTGASLNELAKTLKQAGASHVECWIVARTLARP